MNLSLLLLAATVVSTGPSSHSSAVPAPVYAHRSISGADAQSQTLFDRGLTLYYAYNGSQGVHVFQSAEQSSPDVAMLYWGEALSLGQDINVPVDEDRFHKAHDAIEKAAALAAGATPEERALIEAMRLRYRGSWGDHANAENAYRSAMGTAAAKYPQDDDIGVLYAEAILEKNRFHLWKHDTSLPLNNDTVILVNTLDAVIARNPSHIMANHLQIHVFEPSTDRSRAILAARRLDAMTFAPEDEHLAHMTAHTWIDVGSYALAVAASKRALVLFDTYLATPGIDHTHADYVGHDVAVGFGAAMMLGNYAQTAAFAARLDALAASRGAPATYTLLAKARFARWSELAGVAPKTAADPAHLALAYMKLSRGDAAGAKTELAGIDTKGGSSFAQAMGGAVLAHDGDRKGADAAFTAALATEKAHNAGENIPFVAAGEIIGSTYYRLGDFNAAETAFRDTLSRFPGNARALYGLAESLKKEGKLAQAQAAEKDFTAIWRGSDSPLNMETF